MTFLGTSLRSLVRLRLVICIVFIFVSCLRLYLSIYVSCLCLFLCLFFSLSLVSVFWVYLCVLFDIQCLLSSNQGGKILLHGGRPSLSRSGIFRELLVSDVTFGVVVGLGFHRVVMWDLCPVRLSAESPRSTNAAWKTSHKSNIPRFLPCFCLALFCLASCHAASRRAVWYLPLSSLSCLSLSLPCPFSPHSLPCLVLLVLCLVLCSSVLSCARLPCLVLLSSANTRCLWANHLYGLIYQTVCIIRLCGLSCLRIGLPSSECRVLSCRVNVVLFIV